MTRSASASVGSAAKAAFVRAASKQSEPTSFIEILLAGFCYTLSPVPRLLAILLFALPSFAAQPYHLQLEASPAAVFPYLGKFGTVDLPVSAPGVPARRSHPSRPCSNVPSAARSTNSRRRVTASRTVRQDGSTSGRRTRF